MEFLELLFSLFLISTGMYLDKKIFEHDLQWWCPWKDIAAVYNGYKTKT